MTNFNFKYMGTFLRYMDSNGNQLDLNGSQVDTDLDERTEQNEIDIAALQQYFDSISIKEIATGAVAIFSDGAADIPVKNLTVNIEPIQEGTGDPSPENVRPISGRTVVNIWHDANHDTAADPTITIQLGDTVYGGTLDVLSGVLTVEYEKCMFSQFTWSYISGVFRVNNIYPKATSSTDGWCNAYNITGGTPANAPNYGMSLTSHNWDGNNRIFVKDSRFSNSADFKAWVTENDVYLITRFHDPFTIRLSPQTMSTLLGQNYIWSDSGNVSVNYIADTELYIEFAIAASADTTESTNANNREEVKETINEIEKPDVVEEKEVKDDNIEEEREI